MADYDRKFPGDATALKIGWVVIKASNLDYQVVSTAAQLGVPDFKKLAFDKLVKAIKQRADYWGASVGTAVRAWVITADGLLSQRALLAHATVMDVWDGHEDGMHQALWSPKHFRELRIDDAYLDDLAAKLDAAVHDGYALADYMYAMELDEGTAPKPTDDS